MTRVLPWGTWPSAVDAGTLAAGLARIGDLHADPSGAAWTRSLPDEGGRPTLARVDRPGGFIPAPHAVRSRVHEMGGAPFVVLAGSADGAGGDAVFSDARDDRLYRCHRADGVIHALTAPAPRRFADLQHDRRRNRLVAVAEWHGADAAGGPRGGTPGATGVADAGVVNELVAIDLADGRVRPLVTGADFYASPRLSAEGGRLAWLEWNHPDMPWTGAVLRHAALDADGVPGAASTVALPDASAASQPGWLRDGRLACIADPSGWNNLTVIDGNRVVQPWPEAADYGQPHWVFGQRTWAELPDGGVVARRIHDGRHELVLLRPGCMPAVLPTGWDEHHGILIGEAFHALVGAADRPAAVLRRALTGDPQQPLGAEQVIASAASHGLPPAGTFSRPEAIRFTSARARSGATAHAWFYPPHNPGFTGPDGTAPPLLVMTHGGPTASAGVEFNPRIQHYTSRGWAVVDVDYRGSTGHGRAYQDALDGRWGELDVTDCVAAVQHLVAAGRVDAQRVAIRGGSAGGFTTLAALAFTDAFRAGACHYGIGDLAALARDTHKFESRYVERLAGPPGPDGAAWRARSPLFAADRIRCPVIFLQGSDDRIVPAAQTRSMAEALRQRGVPVRYVEFAGEAHGFRNPDSIRAALAAEEDFLLRAVGLKPGEPA